VRVVVYAGRGERGRMHDKGGLEGWFDEVLMLVLVVTPPSGIRGLLGSECGGLGWSMVDRVVPKVMVPECRG
jgi:hypothetical protein